MADSKVAGALSRVLKKNPKATNVELRKAAERVDARIKKVSGRVFHAKYGMPAKRAAGLIRRPRRKKAAASKRRSRSVRLSEAARANARELVLARDREVIDTLGGKNAQAGYDLAARLDGYIDELATTLRG